SHAIALAYAEIVDGPHVQTAKLEHQIHLRGPTPDAAHLREPGHDLVVTQPGAAEDDGAVKHLRRQVAQRRQLRGRESRAAQRLVARLLYRFGCRAAQRGADAFVNRIGRGTSALLERDGAHQRAEVTVRVARTKLDGPDERNEVRDDRIARRDFVDGRRQRA